MMKGGYQTPAERLQWVRANYNIIMQMDGEQQAKKKYAVAQRDCAMADEYNTVVRTRRILMCDDSYFERGRLYIPQIDGDYDRFRATWLGKVEEQAQKEWLASQVVKTPGVSPALMFEMDE